MDSKMASCDYDSETPIRGMTCDATIFVSPQPANVPSESGACEPAADTQTVDEQDCDELVEAEVEAVEAAATMAAKIAISSARQIASGLVQGLRSQIHLAVALLPAVDEAAERRLDRIAARQRIGERRKRIVRKHDHRST